MFHNYFLILIIFLNFSLYACEKPSMPTDSEWNNWLDDVRNEAKEKKISDQTINLYLLNVKPQKKIIVTIINIICMVHGAGCICVNFRLLWCYLLSFCDINFSKVI